MRTYVYRLQDPDTVYGLVRDLFVAGAMMSLLWAIHHIARGILLGARVKAYDHLADAYTPEEREELIHVIKVQSLRR
jgi:hypothetical protein